MEPSPELKQQLLRFYDATSSGDATHYEQLISRKEGVLGIGTDPNEWWDDYAMLMRVSKAQLQEMSASGITLIPGDPQCYREGSVGWTADRAAIRLPDGAELPVRLTTVFHQENGDWKVVQFHTSVGVPNEDAIGTDLPT